MRITEEDMRRKASGEEQQAQPAPQNKATEPESMKEAVKEELKKEKKKLSELHGTAKIQYLWDYYKWVLAVVLVICVIVSIVHTSVSNAGKIQLMGVMMVDTYSPDSDNNALEEDVKALIATEETDDDDYVFIDTSSYTTDGELDYEYSMQMTVRLAAGELDILIMPTEVFEGYDNGAFYSVEELMGSEFAEKYSDIVVGNGIDVTDNEVLASYGYSFKTDAILAVCLNSEHLDAVREFLGLIGYEVE